MSGRRKYFFQGSHYHIFNRGNHREHVFRDNEDRRFFLSKLDELCERDGVRILAYCLMDNHFHLLLRQEGAVSVAHTMHALLTSYTKRTNYKYGLVGRLFQGPYQSRYIRDEGHLATVSRYMHRNPSKFSDIRTYRWSSYRQYLGASGVAHPGPVLSMFGSIDSYATFVENAPKPGFAANAAAEKSAGTTTG
jgi:REP element-mobilizing transposase RayT